MQIEVRKAELLGTLEKAKTEHVKQAKVALQLYTDKLEKYVAYIESFDGHIPDEVKAPPHLPAFYHTQIISDIKAIKAHVRQTIVMDKHEYDALVSGIRNYISMTSGAMYTLENLNFAN